ncbi:MAG: hypothetical protein IPG38_16580 [Chitinophagaceae bacterium]|nr:hypothetical protein [Chitinophagaceae bacterium]
MPSDENKDFKKNFSLQDETLQMDIPVNGKGLYELQLSWKDEAGLTYYFEKKIFI